MRRTELAPWVKAELVVRSGVAETKAIPDRNGCSARTNVGFALSLGGDEVEAPPTQEFADAKENILHYDA